MEEHDEDKKERIRSSSKKAMIKKKKEKLCTNADPSFLSIPTSSESHGGLMAASMAKVNGSLYPSTATKVIERNEMKTGG